VFVDDQSLRAGPENLQRLEEFNHAILLVGAHGVVGRPRRARFTGVRQDASRIVV